MAQVRSDMAIRAVRSAMADVSPKGLLPQLTDVMYALTESQKLLVGKLQRMRLEHPDDFPSVIVEETHMEDSDSLDEQLGLVVSTTATPRLPIQAQQSIAVDAREPNLRTASESNPGFTMMAARLPHETPAPSSTATTGEATFEDVQDADSADVTPPTGTPAVPPDPTETTPANRHYNFFDDLDARLAHLEEPGGLREQ
jgi:hypothetical protein